MTARWIATAEYVIYRLGRYVYAVDPDCNCEPCEQCGLMPAECTGTDCAATCQCNECDHCHGVAALKYLSKELRKAKQTGAPRRKRRPSMAHSKKRK